MIVVILMIYLYKDLTRKGFTDYQIKKLVKNQQLYMIEKGVYSKSPTYDPLEVIIKKHPNGIVTLELACYCYRLLNQKPKQYVIATKQKDRKILDPRVKQIFMTTKFYDLGKNTITYQGFKMEIYDLERLLIEVVRNKTNIDYEVYQEIIINYHKLRRLLNLEKLNEYMTHFKDPKIEKRIYVEVLKE